MHEKKNFAKTISTINAIENRNKINNALKMYKKIHMLIQTI